MNEFIEWMLNRLRKQSREEEEWKPEELEIIPSDLPPSDSPFPEPPPNKRVIIIDI
jgi:hypothetical protein